jgi:hypothetical protein
MTLESSVLILDLSFAFMQRLNLTLRNLEKSASQAKVFRPMFADQEIMLTDRMQWRVCAMAAASSSMKGPSSRMLSEGWRDISRYASSDRFEIKRKVGFNLTKLSAVLHSNPKTNSSSSAGMEGFHDAVDVVRYGPYGEGLGWGVRGKLHPKAQSAGWSGLGPGCWSFQTQSAVDSM